MGLWCNDLIFKLILTILMWFYITDHGSSGEFESFNCKIYYVFLSNGLDDHLLIRLELDKI